MEADVAVFIITFAHPDHERWVKYQPAHLDWLQSELEEGTLLAAGGMDHGRTGCIIATAADEQAARRWVVHDPYVARGVSDEISITVWDPIFGTWQMESSCAGLSYNDLRREILKRTRTATTD